MIPISALFLNLIQEGLEVKLQVLKFEFFYFMKPLSQLKYFCKKVRDIECDNKSFDYFQTFAAIFPQQFDNLLGIFEKKVLSMTKSSSQLSWRSLKRQSLYLIVIKNNTIRMFISQVLEAKSSQLGVHVDILKTAIALLLSLLLSPIFHILKGKVLRNTVSLLIGSLLLIFVLQELTIFLLSCIIIPFILVSTLPKPFLICVIYSFFVLLYTHCHRFIFQYNQWRVDLSTYLMLFVIKLTYFAKWIEKDSKNKEQSKFLDYLGYNLFFPTIIAGPSFSYQLYLDFLNRKQNVKFSWSKALQPLCLGIPISVISVYFMPIFTSTWFLQSQFYLGLNIFLKALITIPIGFIYRSKFYGAWYIAQTSTNLSGISLTPEGNFNGVIAVSIMFELQPNPKLKTQYWHTGTQQWLRVVVYDALSKKMSGTKALFATFLISAFWHGIYMTYYVGFFLWAMLQHFTKWAYKWSKIVPKEVRSALLFKTFIWLLTTVMMNMIGIFIVILQWNHAISFYKEIYYWPPLAYLVLTLLTFVVKPPRSNVKEKKKQ